MSLVAPSPRPTVGWLGLTVVGFLLFGHAGLLAGLLLWALHLAADPPPAQVALVAVAAFTLAALAWFGSGVPALAEVYLVTRRSVPSILAVIGVVALATAGWRGATDRRRPGDDRADRARAASGELATAVVPAVTAVRDLVVPTARGDRLREVAMLRATAIVVVVWIHALPSEFVPGRSVVDRWIGDVTRFAVPAFVAAAGYLVARHPLAAGWLRRRLERLLVPYLLASLLAIALRTGSDAFPPIEHPLADLLVGATFGPYYFVFALVLLTLATPALVRLSRRGLLLAWGVALVLQVGSELLGGPIFWRVRNPLLWLAWYLAGMLAWRGRDRTGRRLATAWPGLLVAWAVVVAALVTVPDDTPARDLLTLLASWLLVAVLWGWGRAGDRLPAAMWWLDGATYPLYLLHLPFLAVVTGPYGSPLLSLSSVAGLATGMIGAISVVVIGRHTLGRRSRTLLGA